MSESENLKVDDKVYITVGSENLKVNDKVYIRVGDVYRKAVVSRITATQIIVTTKRWDKTDLEWKFRKDFSLVGGDIWSATYLIIPTPELEAKIELEQLTTRVKNMLASCVIPTDKNELLSMMAFLEKYRPLKP